VSFTSAPILKITNPYHPFILECDFSEFELGAILSHSALRTTFSTLLHTCQDKAE
ncbi:uncharacterized protein VP01_15189g1, partial [Puccinia sorghi]